MLLQLSSGDEKLAVIALPTVQTCVASLLRSLGGVQTCQMPWMMRVAPKTSLSNHHPAAAATAVSHSQILRVTERSYFLRAKPFYADAPSTLAER